jgi:hypothetical protein
MNTGKLVGAVAMATVAFVTLAFVQDPQPKRQAGPLVTFAGDGSKIAARRFVKVTSKDQWAALWLEHTGQAAAVGEYQWFYNPGKVPEVDFEQCMVLGVFQGGRWNSAGIEVEEILADGKRTVVRFDDRSFQTEGPDGGGVQGRPFGLFVLPRDTKPIVLEENVQSLIGAPPEWQHRATL